MELRQLRYFIAIAEERGFHRAARRLHVTQPTLTACVQQLEEELGCRLLDRSRRHVAVTAAGAELLLEARRLVDAERLTKAAVRSAAAGRSGRLRVGIIPTAMVPPVAGLLRHFHRDFGSVVLEVQQGHLDEVLARMEAGDLDAVVGRAEAATSRMKCLTLAAEEQGLAVPEGHPLATLGGRIPLRRLEGERILLLRNNRHFGRLLQDVCLERGISPEYRSVGEDFSDLLWLVSAGVGCCPCSMLLGHLVPPGAVLRPLASAPKLSISLIVPGANAHPAAVALARLAVERAREKPV